MGNFLPALANVRPNGNHVPDADPVTNATSATTSSTIQPLRIPSSSTPRYTVFISHAGEDKATIAIPLREKLMAHGITAFVDEPDMPAGTEAPTAMISAMETASVAVIILSPEFVARKWPIKELMCFLRRRDERAAGDPDVPVLIPFFYRLGLSELYAEPRLDRLDKDGNSLYLTSRFLERMNAGEPEAQFETIKASLQKLCTYMGVRNDVQASNDSAYVMYRRRDMLLQELSDKIRQCVQTESMTSIAKASDSSVRSDVFHAYFDETRDTSDLLFEFSREEEDSNAWAQEARLLNLLTDSSRTMKRAIAVRGIAGVGKTSLLRAMSCLDVLKQHFTDGVYRMSLGMDATTQDLIEKLSRAVHHSGGLEKAKAMQTKKEMVEVVECFRSWFEQRKCLFMIDDVWQTRKISANIIHELLTIHVSGEGSKMLLTTRSPDIASRADTDFPLEPRSILANESRKIVIGYAGIEPENDDDNKALKEILERCSGLPLFLAIAGKAIKTLSNRRGHEGCAAYHGYARKLKRNVQSLLTTGVDSFPRLDERLMISINLLEERKNDFGFQVCRNIAELHRRLSVLIRQSKVPISMLEKLWELENESDAATVAWEFEQVGIADVEFERRESKTIEVLGLHDSVYVFAMSETRRCAEEKVGHDALLTGYGLHLAVTKGCREWWHTCFETDQYIYANVCRHLLAAGHSAELVQLLMSPQWIERQLQKNGILSLEADFSLGIKALHLNTEDEIDDDRAELEEALQLISEAATLGWRFVTRNFKELSFQLHGRLVEHGMSKKSIRNFLSRIEEEEKALHVRCLDGCLGQAGGALTKVIPVGGPLFCLAVFADADHVACGSGDGKIFVVDLVHREVNVEWQAHDEAVRAITILENGTRRRILSASDDRTVKVWLVESCRCMATFTGHSMPVNAVEVMQDGRRVVSVSDDGTAQVWQMDTAQVVMPPFTDHKGPVNCVAVLGDGEHVVTGGNDEKLRLWNTKTGLQVGDAFDGHEYFVASVVASPSGQRIVSGSLDDTIRCWNVDSHQQIGAPLRGPQGVVLCVAVKDGHQIVSGSLDKTIRVWDSASGNETCAPLEGHSDSVYSLSFLGDSDSIVSCSGDGTVRVWNLGRQKKKKIASRHGQSVFSVKFSPNGRLVVSASKDKTLRIWNTTSGDQVGHPLLGHINWVRDVAITPDGRRLLSVSNDETLRVWDLESRQLLQTFTGHTSLIWCVAVIPHSDLAVTGSHDQTLRIWDLAAMDGSHVVFEEHRADVTRVFTSDDGLRIISMDVGDNFLVWDLETRNVIKRVRHEDAANLSRRQVLNLVGETTIRDTTTLSIPLWGRQITDGEGADARVLATLESYVFSWALSPDQRTICIGLHDGQVTFMKLER